MNTAFQHPSPNESVGTVGNSRLYPGQLVIEVFSKKKYALARQMIGKIFGSLVQFQKETIVDLAEMELTKAPKAAISSEVSAVLDKAFTGPSRHRIEMDASREFGITPEAAISTSAGEPDPVPSQQAMVERMLQRQYRAMLDDRIPALDGRTPRECARDPARRAALIEWMKGHLHQMESNNRRHRTHFSIDWVVDELGLTELK